MLGREASLSVPPPVAAPQPMRCEAALSPPSMAHAVPTRAAPAPATARPPVAAPTVPAAARAPSPSSASRLPYQPPPPLPLPLLPPLPLQQWRSPPMLPLPRAAGKRSSRCPAPPRAPPPPPAAPPSPAGAPLREGLPIICGAGTSSGRRRQSRWAPGDAKGPVQPVAATPQGQHRLVLRHAPHRCRRARRTSRHDRLRGLNAALPHAASQRRGPGRVQPVVAQSLPGIGAPVVAVGQERRPRELSGRPREGDSLVALVSGLERSRRVQRRVRHRRIAEGLRGVRKIIEIEVARRVDAEAFRFGQVQGEGLALLDVTEDLAEGGLHAEASTSLFLHLYLQQSSEHLAVATVSSSGHVPRHSMHALRAQPARSGAVGSFC